MLWKKLHVSESGTKTHIDCPVQNIRGLQECKGRGLVTAAISWENHFSYSKFASEVEIWLFVAMKFQARATVSPACASPTRHPFAWLTQIVALLSLSAGKNPARPSLAFTSIKIRALSIMIPFDWLLVQSKIAWESTLQRTDDENNILADHSWSGKKSIDWIHHDLLGFQIRIRLLPSWYSFSLTKSWFPRKSVFICPGVSLVINTLGPACVCPWRTFQTWESDLDCAWGIRSHLWYSLVSTKHAPRKYCAIFRHSLYARASHLDLAWRAGAIFCLSSLDWSNMLSTSRGLQQSAVYLCSIGTICYLPFLVWSHPKHTYVRLEKYANQFHGAGAAQRL